MDEPTPRLTAIAAVASNGVIGDGTRLPWHIPADFARFKRVTMGGVLLMGRRTYESLGGALYGRCTVVLTRDPVWRPGRTRGAEVVTVHSVPAAAVELRARAERPWWCAGGGDVYRAWWPYTTDLDLTSVDASPEGTVTFPAIDPAEWRETRREPGAGYAFVGYTRTGDEAAEALRALIRDAV